MEIKLLCSNRYFNISKDADKFKFEGFTLSFDKDFLFEKFGEQSFISKVGLNAIPILEQYPYFIFEGSMADAIAGAGVTNELSLSEKLLERLQFFLFCLWFVKDNSANTDYLYTYVKEKELVFSRTRTVIFSSVKGEYVDVTFSLADLEEAKALYYKINHLRNTKVKIENPEIEDLNTIKQGDYNYVLFNSQNRIDRAILFLTLARSQSYLPLKISFYISIHESLFTTDNTEVSHKVTERAALYIGGNFEEKNSTFKLIKTAYNIRSKFVHGQQLDKKIKTREDLIDISVNLDKITREILSRIITKDSELFLRDDLMLNSWFTSLLLNGEDKLTTTPKNESKPKQIGEYLHA